MEIVTVADRPDLEAQADEAMAGAWPEYNLHGDVLNRYWGRLSTDAADYQLLLWDPGAGTVTARANAIACSWDGTVGGLPAGIDEVVELGFGPAPAAGRGPDTLAALAIVVAPGHRGSGLSRRMITALVEVARAHGLTDLIVPLRPTWKDRYPLIPIERYAYWVGDDGLPFDPWIRTHVRLGGEILRPAPHSLRITGSVAEWEAWTGMAFPDDGDYVVPGGLAPLTVDRGNDLGSYWEPDVWIRHAVAPEA